MDKQARTRRDILKDNIYDTNGLIQSSYCTHHLQQLHSEGKGGGEEGKKKNNKKEEGGEEGGEEGREEDEEKDIIVEEDVSCTEAIGSGSINESDTVTDLAQFQMEADDTRAKMIRDAANKAMTQSEGGEEGDEERDIIVEEDLLCEAANLAIIQSILAKDAEDAEDADDAEDAEEEVSQYRNKIRKLCHNVVPFRNSFCSINVLLTLSE